MAKYNAELIDRLRERNRRLVGLLTACTVVVDHYGQDTGLHIALRAAIEENDDGK
jgi:hypothetical protein